VAYTVAHHEAVFTVAESKALRAELPGAHTKNLFLRDRKGRHMWLVTCSQDRRVDLKALAAVLGVKRLGFASPERLLARLGVIPGAVTPYAVVNDADGVVEMVLDAWVLEHELVCAHPLVNDMTITVKTTELVRFLEASGHPPNVVEIPEAGDASR
jgi:Ala-tRNA(Pro) deacylase